MTAPPMRHDGSILRLSILAVLLCAWMGAPTVWAQSADLYVTKSIKSKTDNPDGTTTIVFDIQVCNNGPDGADGYDLKDVISGDDCYREYTDFTTPSSSDQITQDADGNPIITVTENLAKDGCHTIEIEVIFGADCPMDQLSNEATIQSVNGASDPDSGNNSDTVGPLPVELMHFDVQTDRDAAVLRWATASETSNAGFSVQHRASGASWSTLGFVPGHGTTSQPQDYQYRTSGLAPGGHTFRLKQVDLDGSTALSQAITVTLSLDGSYELAWTGGNPFRTTTGFALRLRERQVVTIGVYDLMGRRVRLLHAGGMAANTRYHFTVSAGALSPGPYFLRVAGERFSATRTLRVVH